MEEIVKCKGIIYDPAVVDACLIIYKTAGKDGFAQINND
jgi:hypothetical protein